MGLALTAPASAQQAPTVPFGVVREPFRPILHNAAFLGTGAPVFDTHDKFGDTDLLVKSRPLHLQPDLRHQLGDQIGLDRLGAALASRSPNP